MRTTLFVVFLALAPALLGVATGEAESSACKPYALRFGDTFAYDRGEGIVETFEVRVPEAAPRRDGSWAEMAILHDEISGYLTIDHYFRPSDLMGELLLIKPSTVLGGNAALLWSNDWPAAVGLLHGRCIAVGDTWLFEEGISGHSQAYARVEPPRADSPDGTRFVVEIGWHQEPASNPRLPYERFHLGDEIAPLRIDYRSPSDRLSFQAGAGDALPPPTRAEPVYARLEAHPRQGQFPYMVGNDRFAGLPSIMAVVEGEPVWPSTPVASLIFERSDPYLTPDGVRGHEIWWSGFGPEWWVLDAVTSHPLFGPPVAERGAAERGAGTTWEACPWSASIDILLGAARLEDLVPDPDHFAFMTYHSDPKLTPSEPCSAIQLSAAHGFLLDIRLDARDGLFLIANLPPDAYAAMMLKHATDQVQP